MKTKKDLIKAGLEAQLSRNKSVLIRSNFNFLNSHKGLRPGFIHTLMGTSGGGKSTVVRSIVLDVLKINPKIKIGFWLSEESLDDIKLEFFKADKSTEWLDNISFESELDYSPQESLKLFSSFTKNNFDILVFDNITTSRMYRDLTPSMQGEFVHGMKAYASKKNIPVLVIAHTGSGVSNGINRRLDQNDVRGSRELPNLTQFWYTIQSIAINNSIFQFLFIEKHRSQEPKIKSFLLRFNEETRHYSGDSEIDFDRMKELFKQRNKL